MAYNYADIIFECDGKRIQSFFGADLSRITIPSFGDTVKLDYYTRNNSSSYGTFKVIDREFRYCDFMDQKFGILDIIIKLERVK